MDFSSINNHNKENGKYNHKIDFPLRTASDSFAKNHTPKIIAIRRTIQILPVKYLFQPVDPPKFSSHNNHGICVKVIEYVLETEKRRLTDLVSENTHGANFSESSIDKLAPVKNGTIIKNNKVSIPSGPNIQHTPEKKRSIIITAKRPKRKSMPTSILTPEDIAMFESSVKIYTFGKTSGPVKSTSNNEHNTSSQISNSTSKQYFSSFAKYIPPKKLDTQLTPNPRSFENQKETKIVNHPTNDTPMSSSVQLTNEDKDQLITLYKAPEPKSPDRHFSDQ